MKITDTDYAKLVDLIKPVMDRMPVVDYRTMNPGFSDKRVRWDYFHAAGVTALKFLCDDLYKYMNDTHMDTALKSIVGV